MTQCLQKDPSKLNQTFIWPREPVVHSKIVGIQVWSLFFVCFFFFFSLVECFYIKQGAWGSFKAFQPQITGEKKKGRLIL